MGNYLQTLIQHVYRKTGKHIGIVGTTGGGKTQVLYEVADGLRTFHPSEVIAWFSTGKSSEDLVLATLGPVMIHVPLDKRIDIESRNYDIRIENIKRNDLGMVLERTFILTPKEGMDVPTMYPIVERKFKANRTDDTEMRRLDMEALIENLSRDHINVIAIRPFIRKAAEYVKALAEFFRVLYDYAYTYKLKKLKILPIAFFFDELQMIAPSKDHALGPAHSAAATDFEYNVDQMRSFRVRIVGAMQQHNRVKTGVRGGIKWWFVKRGAVFHGVKKLERIQARLDSLGDDETLLWAEEKGYYSDELLKFKFYGDGEKYGYIYYLDDPMPAVSSCEGADQQAGSPCE